jgi:TolB protein
MPLVLILSFLAISAMAQTGTVGVFTRAADIGAPPLKGSAEYDPAARRYTITGTGTDIWGRSDQFHYVWREMSGNVAVTATTRFLTEGNPHRKASIMLRRTADPDSAFAHFAIHGDGMPALQFRSATADTTNTLDFPVQGPGTFTLKLVRQGGNIFASVAKDGATLRELGHTVLQLGNPLLVGLAVASHDPKALNTVVFSDVSIEQLPAPPAPTAPVAPVAPVAPTR